MIKEIIRPWRSFGINTAIMLFVSLWRSWQSALLLTFVLEKVLGHLKGAERDALIEQIRAHLLHLKKFNFVKQVAAIEKLIYSNDTDSNPSASSQSSSLPSTNASTVEGPTGSSYAVKNLDSEHSSTPTPSTTAQHQEVN